MDWDRGHFEYFAEQLWPVAEVVVDALGPQPGEVVLDVGCGTGNAALVAAGRGARVTGVDPAPRLLEVARIAATTAGRDADFVAGDAAHLPMPDRSVDGVTSVFGVIFAPDEKAAAAELARVLHPGGRMVLTAWLPNGALAEQAALRHELLADLPGQQANGDLFPWHDVDALAGLLAPYGFTVSMQEEAVAFTAASPEAYADAELTNGPLWVQARDLLEPAGRWAPVRADLVRLFAAANEDPAGFRLTSHYLVASAVLHG